MRGDGTWTLDVDYGPTSVWGVQRYFDEQLEFFNRWLPDDPYPRAQVVDVPEPPFPVEAQDDAAIHRRPPSRV